MDGFCWQGELDLTLFYMIEGCFEKPKSLMTLMNGFRYWKITDNEFDTS